MTTTLLTLTTTPFLALLGLECFRALYHNELLALEELIKVGMDASAEQLLEALEEGYGNAFARWCEKGGSFFAPSPAHIKGQTVVHETCTRMTRAEVVLLDDEHATFTIERDEPMAVDDVRSVMIKMLKDALEGTILAINALELLLDEAQYAHYDLGRAVMKSLLAYYGQDAQEVIVSAKVLARIEVSGTPMVLVKACGHHAQVLVFEEDAWDQWLLDTLSGREKFLPELGRGHTSRMDYMLLAAYAKR